MLHSFRKGNGFPQIQCTLIDRLAADRAVQPQFLTATDICNGMHTAAGDDTAFALCGISQVFQLFQINAGKRAVFCSILS